MHLEKIATQAFDHIFGRTLRRAVLVIVIAGFAIAAIYHFAAAGTLGLEARYGALHAQLIVGGIFAVLALVAYAMLWAMRNKPAIAEGPAVSIPRETQLAVLIEALMAGYSMAKKGKRAR